jgi:MFS family permease
LITTLVNVCSTPISFFIIEKVGRRSIMIWGAVGMFVCEFIVAIIGVTDSSKPAVSAMISFICIYIFFFATTWGPGAWVVIGEIFPLPIRSRGVALSTASNWLWNCVSFATFSVVIPLIHVHRLSPSSLLISLPQLVVELISDPRSSSCGARSAAFALSTHTS